MSFPNNSSGSSDFFPKMYDTGPAHITTFVISCILAPINVILLYSIIWFEHYGVDLKRTLINKSVASMCWCGIYLETVGFLSSCTRYLYGPLPYVACYFRTTLVYAALTSIFLFHDISLISRYCYIFVLKNPAAVEDDFWSLFLNMEIGAFTILSQAVHLFLPGKLPLEFYLCTGTDPAKDGDFSRRNIAFVLTYLLSLLINIYVPIRIRHYQVKYNRRDNDISYSFNLSDLTTGLTIIVGTSMPTLPLFLQYSIIPANVNQYPFNLFAFCVQMIIPRSVTFIVMLVYYIRNITLRVNIWRSLLETFENYSCQHHSNNVPI